MKKSTIRVAVIDDGICTSCYSFLDHLETSIAISSNTIISIPPEPSCTHGTICAGIIKQYAPNAQIVSIKVLDSQNVQGSLSNIFFALEWCLAHHINVINLSASSLSTTRWLYLKSIVSKLAKSHIPLICACANFDKFSIFSTFSWPISVEHNSFLWGNQYFAKNGNMLEADFCASSNHLLPSCNSESQKIVSLNSHATPVVTAAICCYLETNSKISFGTIRQTLVHPFALKERFRIKPLPDFIDISICLGQISYPEKLWMFSSEKNPLHSQVMSQTPFFLSIFPTPNLDYSAIAQLIEKNSDLLCGVLFAGNAPECVKKAIYSSGAMFWDESEYTTALEYLPFTDAPFSAPLLFIDGDLHSSILFAQKLQHHFNSIGYRSIAFSIHHQSYCLGMIYLPVMERAFLDIHRFTDVYEPDIILFCGNSPYLDYDMQVIVHPHTINLCYEKSCEIYDTSYNAICRIIELLK